MELDETELAHCAPPTPICIPKVIKEASGKAEDSGLSWSRAEWGYPAMVR